MFGLLKNPELSKMLYSVSAVLVLKLMINLTSFLVVLILTKLSEELMDLSSCKLYRKISYNIYRSYKSTSRCSRRTYRYNCSRIKHWNSSKQRWNSSWPKSNLRRIPRRNIRFFNCWQRYSI